MVAALEKELPSQSLIKFVTDAGYNKGENLSWIDGKKNIDAYISMNDRREDSKTDLDKAIGRNSFEYDEDADHFVCPTGKLLDFQRPRSSNGVEYAIYKAALSDCQTCPGRQQCLVTATDKKAGAKIIEVDGFHHDRQSMREKMQRPEAKVIYAERCVEPEPVWGHIKKNLGIRRFRMRSFVSMKGEFLIIAIAMNLSKLVRKQIRLSAANHIAMA